MGPRIRADPETCQGGIQGAGPGNPWRIALGVLEAHPRNFTRAARLLVSE